MNADPKPVVTIVYRFLPQYRVDFFCRLRDSLRNEDIQLELVYGKNPNVPKQDERDLDWAVPVRNRVLEIGSRTLYWQPLPARVHNSKLLILLQENGILSNYPILVSAPIRGQKVAFWGHGINFKDKRDSYGNRFKRTYSTSVNWWFAYTSKVARIVAEMGFPENHITVVQNAVDTTTFLKQLSEVRPPEVDRLRGSLGLGDGPVGLFCGGMYHEKRLDFLISACKLIRESKPDFNIVFLGAGPDDARVKAAADEYPWIHYVGPVFGADRAPYFKMADVFLMPGLVGLAVLDCFASELPLITTTYPGHSPEIEYVVNGHNGVIAQDSIDLFVAETLRVLTSQSLREKLKQGCKQSAGRFTLEQMVANFASGVRQALAA